jgi:hypothetical protein
MTIRKRTKPPRAKVKPPALKVGEPLKGTNGNQWRKQAVIVGVGVAIVVCRDSQGFTFTRPHPHYEL